MRKILGAVVAVVVVAAAGARMQRTRAGGPLLGLDEKASLRDAPHDDDAGNGDVGGILEEMRRRANEMESSGALAAEPRDELAASRCPRSSERSAPGARQEWNDAYGVTLEEAGAVKDALRGLRRGGPLDQVQRERLSRCAAMVVSGARELARTASKFSRHYWDGSAEAAGAGPYGFMTPRFEAGAYFATSVALLARGADEDVRKDYESAVEEIKKLLESPPENQPYDGGPVPRRWWVPIREYEAGKGGPSQPDRAKLEAAAAGGFSGFFPVCR